MVAFPYEAGWPNRATGLDGHLPLHCGGLHHPSYPNGAGVWDGAALDEAAVGHLRVLEGRM
ncbi:hypothetical protein [Streptomyces sp. NPDC048650]|uniref:hypothetical protein n=1 Tax=unclassified Streptomyces TaxID=2593676 RepID=UPI00371E5721